MTIPDKYKTQHLFLLIGENPLPNYVAAKLLLDREGTPYLVHTTSTLKEAKCLKQILDSELTGDQTVQLISLESNESDAYRIEQTIKGHINHLSAGRIGLNYTGGTKAMAVHVYRTLLSSEKEQETVFSYLDPRRLKICFDDRVRVPVRPQDIEISLETIFKLHGKQWKNGKTPTTTALLPELAALFAEVFDDKSVVKSWLHWYHQFFCGGDDDQGNAARKRKANGQWGEWKSNTALAALSFPITCLPPKLFAGFRKEGYIISSEGSSEKQFSLKAVKDVGQFGELKDFCKWLDGLWLEHYLLNKIQSIPESFFVSNYGMNFEVPLSGTQGGFEFDVAFTHGYQLFAIACTTSADRGLCKLKLFEAYFRAQQMGGSEARVALVCCVDDPDSLKAELDNPSADKQIRVFGRSHILSLKEEIEKWIKDNDREANA